MITKSHLQTMLISILGKQKTFDKDTPDWILMEGAIIIINQMITSIDNTFRL